MKPHISRTGRQVFTSKADFIRRNDLPYGIWTTEDGRQILFNRFYEPIWERRDGQAPTPADPTEWIKGPATQHWFYGDEHGDPAKRRRALAALKDWGIE